jgi:hypothetical protein
MIKLTKILFLSLLIIGVNSESFSKSFRSKRKPKWVSSRPIDNDYYIGIGKANKIQADYMQIAKNNALSDIISEISVSISSSSILHQLEDNSGYKEKYEALIQTSVKDDIKNYEIVDSWSNKEEYWVYYRLSKKEYERLKREKLERAKRISKDFYEKGKAYEKEYDINNALIYYIKSFDAIKKHLGDDLSTFTFDGRIFLDNAIFQSIQDIFSRLKFIPEKDQYEIKALSSENDPVIIKVKLRTELETQNIANIPVIFSFPHLDIDEQEYVVSSTKGKAECTIANMVPKGRSQIIEARLDIDHYFGVDSEDNILKNILLERSIRASGNINIVVKELFAYLESQERMFYEEALSTPISQIFKRELSENFFSFTNDIQKADVVIKINSEIVKGTKLDKHNLHTVFLNCNISIKDLKADLIIFTEGIENIKGIKSGSFESAAQDAILKAEKRIQSVIIPNIRTLNL